MIAPAVSGLTLRGLRFPPKDLQLSLGQQLATLRAAREAVAQVGELPTERTGVLIGMEPDPEVARWGTRWRLPEGKTTVRDRVVPAARIPGVTEGSVRGGRSADCRPGFGSGHCQRCCSCNGTRPRHHVEMQPEIRLPRWNALGHNLRVL